MLQICTRYITYDKYNDHDPHIIERNTLAVRVERVRESSLLSGVDRQAVELLDLNPSNDVGALEGVERGEPGSGVLVALGLVKIVGNSNQLRSSEVVGELFAASSGPSAGTADPGFLQRNNMVLQTHLN